AHVVAQVLLLVALGSGCNRSERDTSARETATPMTPIPSHVDTMARASSDQSGASQGSDQETTNRIRQALATAPDLSADAKNLTVTTTRGRTTRTGIVDSPADRDHVVEIARRVAGPSNVDDELDVKTR